MMEINVLIEAPELASAINSLAKAISNTKPMETKDTASLSDVEMATRPAPNDPSQYSMFKDMAAAAQKLQEADPEAYERVLNQYVEAGDKYSAIQPKDWARAMKAFQKTLANLAAEEEYEEDYDDVIEVEAPRLTVGELRALAAKAKNAGVPVGAMMKEHTGVTKISAIPEEKYNAFEDALRTAMES